MNKVDLQVKMRSIDSVLGRRVEMKVVKLVVCEHFSKYLKMNKVVGILPTWFHLQVVIFCKNRHKIQRFFMRKFNKHVIHRHGGECIQVYRGLMLACLAQPFPVGPILGVVHRF